MVCLIFIRYFRKCYLFICNISSPKSQPIAFWIQNSYNYFFLLCITYKRCKNYRYMIRLFGNHFFCLKSISTWRRREKKHHTVYNMSFCRTYTWQMFFTKLKSTKLIWWMISTIQKRNAWLFKSQSGSVKPH